MIFILLCFLVCYKGRAYMDSLKRGRYDFFLIICSELILNGSCGEDIRVQTRVFRKVPKTVTRENRPRFFLLYTTLIISASIRDKVPYRFMFYSELPFFLFRFHVCIRLSRASVALSSHGVGLFRIFISQNVLERFMSRCTLKALEM